MNHKRTIFASLIIVGFSLLPPARTLRQETTFSAYKLGSAFNRPVSAMTNGYGGYYVPRNAYGNNYQGQRFTNPTGYIIPAQQGQPMNRRIGCVDDKSPRDNKPSVKGERLFSHDLAANLQRIFFTVGRATIDIG